MNRRILIDTDTASDDAVALIMALRSPLVSVEAITVVGGNCPLQQATSNALYTAELCRSNVPVYSGAAKPLTRDLEVADWFHGRDGLGDHGFRPSHHKVEAEHAVDAILRIVRAHPGIELVTLGPLTNIAMALDCDPSLVKNVARCVVMGGAPNCEGNVTPAAEFNIWVDPEAASKVFRSGLPIEMVGWQLCRGSAVFSPHDIAVLRHMKTPLAEFAVTCNSTAIEAYRKQTGEIGISLPDPVAMGILLRPDLCVASSNHFVEIETEGKFTRGMTVVDRLHVTKDARNQNLWADVHRHPPRTYLLAPLCGAVETVGDRFAALVSADRMEIEPLKKVPKKFENDIFPSTTAFACSGDIAGSLGVAGSLGLGRWGQYTQTPEGLARGSR